MVAMLVKVVRKGYAFNRDSLVGLTPESSAPPPRCQAASQPAALSTAKHVKQ